MKSHSLLFIPLCLLLSSPATSLVADEVKLKTGQTFTGRITYEAADMVKMEVAVSASIKETKIFARADIESIVKAAPDDLEFEKIEKLVPTASLVPVDAYRKMLETGPDSFLRAFPGSRHTAKVQEIRDTLAKELDQVERGFLKIENEWISPQDKIDFPELVDSRVRLIRMGAYSRSNNINSLIGALREFEFLEENYLGSPAFPKAVELAKEVISNLGRQLQTLAANVVYQNTEYEKQMAASSPESRAQLTEARAREDKAHADLVAADKKAGVKWVQLNFRSKPAIDEYLKLASAELARVRAYDTTVLAAQAEQLVAVDRLIAENKVAEAKAKLAEAAALTGTKTESKTKSKSSSKGVGKSGSYLAVLGAKIKAKEEDEAAKQKAKEAASDSEALTANLKKTETGAAVEGDPAKAAGEGAEKPAEPIDEFAALGASKKGTEKSEPAKGDAKESKSKSKSKSKAASSPDDEDEEEDGKRKARPAVVEEEGGFPGWMIGVIIAGIAGIAIAVMKVLGIGGKKAE